MGRISFLCWTVFTVMCAAFLPLAIGIERLHALPETARVPVAVAVVSVLWWGPFVYAISLAMAVYKHGDRRLLAHGLRGRADVLSAEATGMTVSAGGGRYGGSRVYKYRLRVSVAGRRPYETVCRVCQRGFGTGTTVEVAVSRHNRNRVMIDFGQGPADRRPVEGIEVLLGLPPEPEDTIPAPQDTIPEPQDTIPEPVSPSTLRIRELVDLNRRHREGELTDAEYAAEKARVVGQ
ncbi:SHOCT domain-containing protein [Actinomadura sp. DC4]|uniref:SHOCT domain-containing protein n=1 Tax=Actinomadura sp. DC4 TaxID=3055069 RepID=UPI0025AFC193|nr:SHOCT domain-containing protein [Actinomadura sp. DC4]MDN3354246.1 SHOCT domain-containing protein [Actinomadura sp. DC4]